jgi:hypothetical protein
MCTASAWAREPQPLMRVAPLLAVQGFLSGTLPYLSSLSRLTRLAFTPEASGLAPHTRMAPSSPCTAARTRHSLRGPRGR